MAEGNLHDGHAAVRQVENTGKAAERSNQVWALDYQFDETANERIPELLNIVDEHTRGALAALSRRRITRAPRSQPRADRHRTRVCTKADPL